VHDEGHTVALYDEDEVIMVICEKYNFVFLRVPKNASSSLAEFFVRNFCDMGDKWTDVNDCGLPMNNIPRELVYKYADKYRYIHLTLEELVQNRMLPPTDLERKRIITVIRDPLMRQLSLYFFLKRVETPSIEEFRSIFKDGYHASDPSNKILQTEYPRVYGYDYGEYWLYNKLDRYVDSFAKQNNVIPQNSLQKFKSGFTPQQVNLIDKWYDQKTLDAVRKYYEKDFEKIIELETGLELS